MTVRSSRWKKTRALAFKRDKRDNAKCHLCGRPIDYTLEPSSCDEAYEADHVLPVSTHPEFENDLLNVKASHKRCNRARSNKAALRGMGTPTRRW